MHWFKRGYVSIVETLISNAAIGCSTWPMFFTTAEQELLLERYAGFENLITPGKTSKCANAMRDIHST